MNKVSSCQLGFTLVELLIALTIFSVGLLAIAGMQVTSIKANFNSNIRSTAIAAGQGTLEDLSALPNSNPIFNLPGPNSGTFEVRVKDGTADRIYNANYIVTHDTPINDMVSIQVTVVSAWDVKTRYTLTDYKRIK